MVGAHGWIAIVGTCQAEYLGLFGIEDGHQHPARFAPQTEERQAAVGKPIHGLLPGCLFHLNPRPWSMAHDPPHYGFQEGYETARSVTTSAKPRTSAYVAKRKGTWIRTPTYR